MFSFDLEGINLVFVSLQMNCTCVPTKLDEQNAQVVFLQVVFLQVVILVCVPFFCSSIDINPSFYSANVTFL